MMTRSALRLVPPAVLAAAFFLAPAAPAGDEQKTDPAGVEFFEKKVRPVLVENCFKCHSARANKSRGGLRLDSRAALLKGGDNGPALVPGDPEKSLLIEAVSYANVELRMPKSSKLPDAAIADLRAWVKMGAPWPREKEPEDPLVKIEFDLNKRKREHWSWQPIRPPTPPKVKDELWPSDPVDAFLLAKLEANGLTPAVPADKRTLIRRAYFDLIGLPPTPEEVEAFLKDDGADAFAKVVDRLLASDSFGERWARHWLDLVRYAESRGHEFDPNIPDAYQYRDYVIRALNADVPYNQFVTEHLAGDLLPEPRLHPTQGFNESILGTGFWFLGEEVHSPVDVRQDEADRFDNRIDVLGKTFLGLTVACARCHDHKFDAISTKDYYSLFGFLESSGYRLARFDTLTHNRRVAEDLWKLRDRSRAPLQRAVADSLKPAANETARYLLAAREAIRSVGPHAARVQDFSKEQRQRIAEIAQKHQLDGERLARWTARVLAAAGDATDPLHAWAKVAAPDADEPKRLAEILKPLIDADRRRAADAANGLKNAEVVLDYAKPGAADWLPDDVSFGPGPARPGDVRFADEPSRPVARVVDYGAAEIDPAWNGLKLAPGAESDAEALGKLLRAGRTLRTPTFTLTGGKLYYLVRGTGRAYAAVAQHALIAGPLHGQLVAPIKAGGRFQWVAHDLTAYKGQRTYLEFTAAENVDFAVAMVVQADQPPGALEAPNRLWARVLESDDARSSEKLAAAYQRVLLDSLDRFGADRLIGAADAADHARLVNWLLQSPELFAAGGHETALAEASAPFRAERARLVARIRKESRLAPAMQDGSGVEGSVFIRGSHKNPGEVVPRRFLEALAGPERLPIARGSGRLELARQMTDPKLNPYLTRVLVNRVWHHLFGRGVVASVDNFGVLGERPTHPELLDHLADQFVKDGWSVKKLIRKLMLSSAYRMSSQPDEKAERADPQNLLLHRMRLRRLEGEAIRDAMLAVSGRLNPALYGRPVSVHLTEFQDGRGRPASGPLDGDGRRSIYLAVRRNFLSSFLLAFDTPIPFSTVGRRSVSNVPAQALILMNDPFVHQQADLWAKRVLRQPGTAKERVEGMYLSAFGRPPGDDELRSCLDFLARQTQAGDSKPADGEYAPAAWKDLAHVLFNVKEFIFLN